MIAFIYIPIISICAITWVHFVAAPGNMFAPLSRFGNKYLPYFLARPLFQCADCLSGWLAIAYYLYYIEVSLTVIPFCFVTMFFTNSIYKLLRPYE